MSEAIGQRGRRRAGGQRSSSSGATCGCLAAAAAVTVQRRENLNDFFLCFGVVLFVIVVRRLPPPSRFFSFRSLSGSAHYAPWPPPLAMGARRVSEPSVRNWAPVQATGNKRFLTAVVAALVAPCPALPSSLLRTSLLYALFQSQVWRGCWESAQTTNNASEGGSRVAGRRFWQRQCNGRARGIGSVSYVFWGAYETVKRRGAEREGGR